MQQYLALKEAAPDSLLFYRMGDFFELFFDDARQAARILDIALTARGEHGGKPVQMCGVPVHAAEGYLARLIKAGCKVAIAEQVETPAEAKARAKREGRPTSKALVKRDIVRFVTAGTLTEEALLEPRRANLIAAVVELRGTIGLASCDISTGLMVLEECLPKEIDAEIARIGPSEVVVPEGWGHPLENTEPFDGSEFASDRGAERLCSLHEVSTLDAFGDFSRAMLAAAGGLVAYLDHVGRGNLPLLLPPAVKLSKATMSMDKATRANLEILESANGQSAQAKASTLISAVDRCSTGAGSRLLAQDLSDPLYDEQAIDDRLALVQFWLDQPIERADLRDRLRKMPDIARALGRIAASRAGPRDLGQIRDGLAGADAVFHALAKVQDQPQLLTSLLPALIGHHPLIDVLSRALIPSPPTERSKGGFIAEGYDASLDELRQISGNARRAIAALEARYRDETKISSLKIKHNGVLGYFIEVPARYADGLMEPQSGFTHRQTMKGAVRFNSLGLHEEASRIAESGGHALAAEEAHFEELSQAVCEARNAIATTAAALARIDVASANADRASEGDWCRPVISADTRLSIVGGWHPVVEAALSKTGDRFVANDCALSNDDRLWLIGGPNMGGKSTFLRQNALIVLMAQAGCFVPARTAEIGLTDRLFSRVGASDNLARGRSTFMVEMVETAAILSQASERSFVILDEVGRGTSTYDGLALAWAVAEAVHSQIGCRCLFATHYHELARLAEQCEALSLHHVRAREWKGDLVLLHELAKGPADKSYGLAVAKLAGVPEKVIARARQVLEKLEEARTQTGGIAAGLGELPLFAAALAEDQDQHNEDTLEERLKQTELDTLSAREALELLYQWKHEIADQKG